MLDDQLLESFMGTFYGYGNYRGKYWFVGMEEGGGRTIEGNANRLRVWADRGMKELEDLVGYCYEVTPKGGWARKYFAQQPRTQRTWNKLIRIALAAEGESTSLEAVKAYQRDRLGRENSDNCLLELLPLPSPSTGHWFYASHSPLPHLQTRQEYMGHYAPRRAEHLSLRVSVHRPAVVVFYSVNWWYRQWWRKIAGVQFNEVTIDEEMFLMGANRYTVFAITKHPAAKGISNDYFHQIGKNIALQCSAHRPLSMS